MPVERLKRTVFFWTLVVLFIIIAPMVVFYARGYRFDIHRGVFVHSGIITIKSNPQAINVDIDGNLVASKSLNRINNSYNISGLIPGSYDVTVKADGFQTWNKSTEVHSGLSSEFWNILLVKNNYDRTDYNAAGIGKFFISPNNKFIAYAQTADNIFSVKVLDIQNKNIVNDLYFPDWKFIDEVKKENIEWSPDESYLSVPVQKSASASLNARSKIAKDETQYAYFIIDPNTNTSFSLNELLKIDGINYVRWDPKQKGVLFFLSKNTLYRVDVNDPAGIKQIAQDVSSFDLSKTNAYYSQMPNELVYKANLDGSSVQQLTNSFPENLIQPNFRLIVYDDLRIAFLNENKDLFIFNRGEHDDYFKKISSDISGIQFSDDGKKLLYWTDNEASVYYLRDWNVSPLRTEDSTEEITRFSEDIKNIQWFKDYEHIIFSVGTQIKIIELDPRDHRNLMNLTATSSDNSSVIFDNSLENLFFTDAKDSSFSLFSIDFPEKVGILGIAGL